MRRMLFPLAAIGCAIAAIMLIWAWSTDRFLIDDCRDAGGRWNAETRVCELSAGLLRQARVSPRR